VQDVPFIDEESLEELYERAESAQTLLKQAEADAPGIVSELEETFYETLNPSLPIS
jgi:hypothetical protein